MRPLNRPMFRYGGPIKEGVMSGIREPYRHGQRVMPSSDGRRPGYAGPATPFIPWLWAAGTRLIGGQAVKKIGQQGVKKMTQNLNLSTPKNMQGIFDQTVKQVKDKGIPTVKGGWKNIGKNWFSGDPLVKGSKWGWKTITSPTANTWAQKAVKMATSPSSILIGGLYYANGKWFNKDGSPANENDIAAAKASTGGPPGGGDPGMQGTGEWFAAQAEKEALAKKQKEWNNRIKRYRDIMDIKGMNKDAAYKSLVDASKLIQDSQDFKGDIKSGKLINQVIQAASKQFEKPAKTSDAINTLILQNELKKDLSAETDALDKLYKQGRIAVDQKALNPSKSDLIGAYAKAGVKGQNLYDSAAKELSGNSGQTFRGNLIENSEFKEILADLKKNPETKNADDITIIATWTQNELNNSNKNIPDGNYTVGSTIVTIKDKQVVDVN